MKAINSSLLRQTVTLIKKNFLVLVLRRPIAFLCISYLLPIGLLALLLNIQNLNPPPDNRYGVGPIYTLSSLAESLQAASDKRLVIIRPPDLHDEVDAVIERLVQPIPRDRYVISPDELETLELCPTGANGDTPCFAAVVFFDSPSTEPNEALERNSTWAYIIRTGPESNQRFDVFSNDDDLDRVDLPVQVAVDNAIIDSDIQPDVIKYTRETSEDVRVENLADVSDFMVRQYGFALFVIMLGMVYSVTYMITSERDAGLSQLIDSMGGSATSRVLSSVIAYDAIFLPCWILFGALYQQLLWRRMAAGSVIGWQVLTGLAVNHSAIFAAAFFKKSRLSVVYIMAIFLFLSGMAHYVQAADATEITVLALSVLFPSSSMLFFMASMNRFLGNDMAPGLGPVPSVETNNGLPPSYRAEGRVLLAILAVQVIIYPLLALLVERFRHGIQFRHRTFAPDVDESSPIVQIKGLTKIYKRRKQVTEALTNINLEVNEGEIMCLNGPNGSGKTTTLNLVAGFQRPTSGEIVINAKPSEIGICPQRNTLWDSLTVKEHLQVWGAIKSGQKDDAMAASVIEACSLTSKMNTKSSALSGGQKRRLQLACMFAANAKLCLIDECTSGLDPLSRRIIWNLLLAQRASRTILFTTHFLDEVDVLADRMTILSKGAIEYEGPTVTLKNQYGGGYRVSVPRHSAQSFNDVPARVHQDRILYTVPDAEAAGHLAKRFYSEGVSDVYISSPDVGDAFFNIIKPNVVTGEEDTLADASTPLTTGTTITFWQQVQVLLWKRLLVLKRQWWPYLFVLVLPLAFVPVLDIYMDGVIVSRCTRMEETIRPAYGVSVSSPMPSEWYTDYGEEPPHVLLGGPQSTNQSLYNIVEAGFPIFEWFEAEMYPQWVYLTDSLDQWTGYLRQNAGSTVPGGIYMRDNTTSPTLALPLYRGTRGPMAMISLWSQMRSGVPIRVLEGRLGTQGQSSNNEGLMWAIFVNVILAVYTAGFVFYPAYEKSSGIRAMQYVNGVRRGPLWVAHAIFDGVFVLVVAAAFTGILGAQLSGANAIVPGVMFLVLLLYGFCGMLISYIVTVFCRGSIVAFLITAIIGLLQLAIYLIPLTMVDGAALYYSADREKRILTMVLDIFFPVGNVVHATSYMVNLFRLACQGEDFVPPEHILAYSGPVLFLFLQSLALLALLVWLESDGLFYFSRLLPLIRRRKQGTSTYEVANAHLQDAGEKGGVVPTSTPDLSLDVMNVSHKFGSLTALEDVTLQVSKGEVLGLLGCNGAGKSTLVNLARGVMKPTEGTILVCGEDALSIPAQKHIGVCPQQDAVDILTTKEQLRFFALIKGVPKSQVDHDVLTLMSQLGLTPHSKKRVSKLSGGNKRKLMLAIALIGMPELVMLDEPTSAMDSVAQRAFWKLIASIASNTSIVLTTHSMEEADTLASRVAILSRRLLAVGTTQSLREKYSNLYHVRLMLTSAPRSSEDELEAVKTWVKTRFPDAELEDHAPGGHVGFCIPQAAAGGPGKQGVIALIENLEKEKGSLGVASYSIEGSTLERVFLGLAGEARESLELREK